MGPGRAFALVLLVCADGVLASCARDLGAAGTTPALPSSDGWHLVPDILFTKQTEPRDCGVAALTMALSHWRANVDADRIRRLIGPVVTSEGIAAGALRGAVRGLRCAIGRRPDSRRNDRRWR